MLVQRINVRELNRQSINRGFRKDYLGKLCLLSLFLDEAGKRPALAGRLAVKGGTALHLFHSEVARLSEDIDWNLLDNGSGDCSLAPDSSPVVELEEMFRDAGMSVEERPRRDDYGHWILKFQGLSGRNERIAIDATVQYAVPLWEPETLDATEVAGFGARGILVADRHELVAGKLCATMARKRPRDLFDIPFALGIEGLNEAKLRLATVVYMAAETKDVRNELVSNVQVYPGEVSKELAPLLAGKLLRKDDPEEARDYAEALTLKARSMLATILPLRPSEREFVRKVRQEAVIDPVLVTSNKEWQERINNCSALPGRSGGCEPGDS